MPNLKVFFVIVDNKEAQTGQKQYVPYNSVREHTNHMNILLDIMMSFKQKVNIIVLEGIQSYIYMYIHAVMVWKQLLDTNHTFF